MFTTQYTSPQTLMELFLSSLKHAILTTSLDNICFMARCLLYRGACMQTICASLLALDGSVVCGPPSTSEEVLTCDRYGVAKLSRAENPFCSVTPFTGPIYDDFGLFSCHSEPSCTFERIASQAWDYIYDSVPILSMHKNTTKKWRSFFGIGNSVGVSSLFKASSMCGLTNRLSQGPSHAEFPRLYTCSYVRLGPSDSERLFC